METIFVCSDVEIDDIAFLQGSSIGDSVTDDLINGGAAAAREVVIVAGRGVSSCVDNIVVHNSVNFLSCDTYSDCCVACIESFSCDSADTPQLF